MNATRHKKLSQLSDIVPLETPLSLLVDPSNACNFKCTFCPTGDPELLKSVNRPLGIMKEALFRKIVDDLKAFSRPLRSILLYKDGEPLLNKKLPEMIAYATANGVTEDISITTNGALLTPEKSAALIDAGLTSIRVSVEHVTDEDYERVTQTFGDYRAIVDNVAAFHDANNQRGHPVSSHIKIVDSGLSSEQKQKFLDDFGPLADVATIMIFD